MYTIYLIICYPVYLSFFRLLNLSGLGRLGVCHDYQRSTPWSVVYWLCLVVTELTNPIHSEMEKVVLWKIWWVHVQVTIDTVLVWGKTTDKPMFNRCGGRQSMNLSSMFNRCWLYEKSFLGSPTCEPLWTYGIYTCMFQCIFVSQGSTTFIKKTKTRFNNQSCDNSFSFSCHRIPSDPRARLVNPLVCSDHIIFLVMIF